MYHNSAPITNAVRHIKVHSTSCWSLVFGLTSRHVYLSDPSSSHDGRLVSQDTYAAAAYRAARGVCAS
jgi:hypothetical protein